MDSVAACSRVALFLTALLDPFFVSTSRAGNPEFRKVFRLTYDSTVLRKLRFNVYDLDSSKKQMDDEDRMGSAMMLLKEVVDGAGIEFVYRLTHENPTKQQALIKGGATIVIQCSSKSEMALDMTTTKSPTPQSIAAAGGSSSAETLRKLQSSLLSGDVFTFHYASKDPLQRFLFYTIGSGSGSSDLGTLYWCAVGSRTQEAASSIALRELSEVIVGKKVADSTPFDSTVPSGNCFTLIGEDHQRVDVECRSTKQRDDWAWAIIGIVRAVGQNVKVQEIA
jgi:hypothetical protein